MSDVEDKIIAETIIGNITISTEVHNREYNSLLINLEDPEGWFKKPYSSEEEAIEGHEEWCNYIRKNQHKLKEKHCVTRDVNLMCEKCFIDFIANN